MKGNGALAHTFFLSGQLFIVDQVAERCSGRIDRLRILPHLTNYPLYQNILGAVKKSINLTNVLTEVAIPNRTPANMPVCTRCLPFA